MLTRLGLLFFASLLLVNTAYSQSGRPSPQRNPGSRSSTMQVELPTPVAETPVPLVGGGGGGGQIAGVQVTQVASTIGGSGGSERPLSGGQSGGRTDEEIQIVFDRYKASLYRLYNRELRNDPTIRGQVVIRLTIEPDGSVSLCQLQSSDMNAPALAEQVLDRIRGFDFGAKDGIVAMTIIYPIDFLPAA
jgi:hypothetical protein